MDQLSTWSGQASILLSEPNPEKPQYHPTTIMPSLESQAGATQLSELTSLSEHL